MTRADPPQGSLGDLPAGAPDLSIETGWSAGRATVWVSGEVDMITSPQLGEALDRFRAASGGPVEVDLSNVTFMSADGLTVLLHAHRSLLADGKEGLLVVGASGLAKRIIEITGLGFLLYETQAPRATGSEAATQQGLDLDAARRAAHLSITALYVAYFALGGTADLTDFKAFLSGRTGPMDAHQLDVAAHAINERLAGLDFPDSLPSYPSAPIALRAG
jgi:anti-sigma B factor antagonist